MATREELLVALRAADAAGDTAAAAAIARRLAGGGGSSAPAPTAAPEPAAAPARPYQRAGGLNAGGAGAAQFAIKSAMGLKSLLTDLSDEDKGVLAAIKEEAENDPEPWKRTGGELAANVATTMIPGAKMAKAVQGIKMLPRALSFLAPAMVVSGAQEAALAPATGEGVVERAGEKLKEGAKAAALGGALATGGKVLSKTLTGMFRPSADAVTAFKAGVNPTLQQGADSAWGRFVGGLTTGALPTKVRQGDEVADALLNRVTQGNVAMPKATGGEYYDAAKNYVANLYDTVMAGKRLPISPTTRGEVAQAASQLNKTGQFAREAQDASRIVGNIMGDSPRNINVNSETLRKNYLTPLAEEAYTPGLPEELKRRILAARDMLIAKARTTRLTPQEQALLKEADTLHFDVSRMREATAGARSKEGIDVRRLIKAYEDNAMAGNTTGDDLIFPVSRLLQKAPNQDQSRGALVAAGRVGAGMGAGTAATLAAGPVGGAAVGTLYGLSLAGQTAPGARYLMGQNDWQKRLADYLRQAAPYGASAGQTLSGE